MYASKNFCGGKFMKKKWYVLAAGVLATSLILGTACGKEKPDTDAPAFTDPDAVLSLSGSVDKTTASRKVSSDLFGIFLEDINYASYALDSNLIVNGSFEYSKNNLYGWTNSGVSLAATTQEGVFKNNADFAADVNPTCAAVSAITAGGSITNAGYAPVPIAVKEGVTYTFSAFVKAPDYNGDCKISVVDGAKEYAAGTIRIAKSDDWVKYAVSLPATDTASKDLSLKITFAEAGMLLYLDNVLLETGDATSGIKNYLYRAIADLSPAFIRFPGGCIIEGKSDATAYDWKNSVGATKIADNGVADTVPAFEYTLVKDGKSQTVTSYGERATRVPNTDLWQRGSNYYEMDYGIGFYEYFFLCDRLGASAIPIVNCGYSCQTQTGAPGSGVALKGRHGNGIEDFIQDAKDLVCFAKGSVSSQDANEAYWARVRSNMGHPEPFEMDYLGIGNEQWGVYYTQYYERFLQEFSAAATENPIYGSVKLIVGNCTLFGNCEYPENQRKGAALEAATKFKNAKKIDAISEYGVVDQHYYMNYTDFLMAATEDFYKDYKRPVDGNEDYEQSNEEYYEVFVGEYSANNAELHYPDWDSSKKNPFTNNSWITALSEAALMTSFERNGDIVRLAAYAPMFGNLAPEQNQWAVDMMFYNNTDVVLTGNYYVQQLFMKNAGDYKINSALTFSSGETPVTEYTRPIKRTVNDVYTVTTADEETGDVIVKIVNAGKKTIRLNIDYSNLNVKKKSFASVTELSGAIPTETSSPDGSVVTPRAYTVGGFTNSMLGYTAEPYSVTAIRIRTK